MKIRTKNASVNSEEIAEVEKKYSFSIPVEYKEFLLKYNGGYTSINDFNLPNGNRVLFNRFLSIKYDEPNVEDIHEYLQVDEDIVPKKYFIFGLDPFGNCFCINRENGNVEVWYHDNEAEEADFVCQSFPYFVDAILEIKG